MINQNDIFDILRNELECEKSFKEAVIWKNHDIEKNIKKIEEELSKESYPCSLDCDVDRETLRNKQLCEANNKLKSQIPEIREKIKAARTCESNCKLTHDDSSINLDLLTQPELLKTVKKFERNKTDLMSIIKSKEWRLDSEAKLVTRLIDQKTYLQNELMVWQHSLIKLQKLGLCRYKVLESNENRDQKYLTSITNRGVYQRKLPPIGM